VANPVQEGLPITPLTLPEADPVEFSRNFLEVAVCELRFPTLLAFEDKAPIGLQTALRKEYPHYTPGTRVTIGPGKMEGETRYSFGSRQKDYMVTFRASAIALETSKYTTFETFKRRLDAVIATAKPFIDSEFFTRVGLRYINGIPVTDDLGAWINEDLSRPLMKGVLGTVSKYWLEARGTTRVGEYSFRHGYPGGEPEDTATYKLDFDLFRSDVPVADTLGLLDDLHREAFKFFHWCLGPASRAALGPAKRKQQR
jgi:uncharacterized protein (TIGR04255 family)